MAAALEVERVHVYASGMRVVEANLVARVEEWARQHRCLCLAEPAASADWIRVEFQRESDSSLFALTFDTQLSIRCPQNF